MRHPLCTVLALSSAALFAQSAVKPLPAPQKDGGMPLMQVLQNRKSNRDFNIGFMLSEQHLSNLLWAANGFNRDKMRTAPSAMNAQAIDIYVVSEEAIWLFEPEKHALTKVKDGDFRKATGRQPFVANASVNLVYVYDLKKAPGGNVRWGAVDAAFCAENVYLYCAQAKLKTVVRGGWGDNLAEVLGLPQDKQVVLCQSIGG